jgi:hypothetical protein
MHVHPLSIRGTGISIKCGGAKLVFVPNGDISISIHYTDARLIATNMICCAIIFSFFKYCNNI